MVHLAGFDASQVEPVTTFEPIPAGKYLAAITDSAMKPNKAGTGQFLELTFTILEGEYKGRLLWTRLNLENPNELAVKIARAELRRLLGVEARRGRQYCGCDEAPDVAVAIPGVHVEVKRVESLRLYPALKQAATDAGQNVPLVLHRANGKPWVAIVRLEDLPKLAVQHYLTLAQQQQADMAKRKSKTLLAFGDVRVPRHHPFALEILCQLPDGTEA